MKMSKLTEDMIIARTKSSELGAVKKLNCWGSDLVDVSLVKRLNNVEVLSLSLNKIGTLSDFQYCRNLVELYIRRNAISDLSEICYLQDLSRLRRLLLAENPCVETAGPLYRATVLRCLPNLEVLDNSEVTPDEVEQALKVGLILEHPLSRRDRVSPDYYREEISPTNRRASAPIQIQEYEEVFRNSTNALSRSPPSDYTPYIHQPEEKVKIERSPPESPVAVTAPTEVSSSGVGSTSPSSNGLRHRRNSFQSSGSLAEASSANNNNTNNEVNSMRKVQRSPVQEYYPQGQRDSVEREGTNGYGQRRNEYNAAPPDSGRGYVQELYYNNESPPPPQHRNSVPQSGRYAQNHQSARSKPRNKQSNLLSATLCLINELDWASLQVVEHAIQRRMDELSSD